MLCGLFLGFGHLKKEPPLSLHGLASHRGRASLIDLIRDCGYFSDFSGMYLSACVGNFPVKEACPCFFLGTGNSLFPSGTIYIVLESSQCCMFCGTHFCSQGPPTWHLNCATIIASVSSQARHKAILCAAPERPDCWMHVPLFSFLLEGAAGSWDVFSWLYYTTLVMRGPRVGKCNKLSCLLWWGFYWLCAHRGLATSKLGSGFSQRQISKIYLFLNWRIIALQNFVVFCQTSTWISHKGNWICVLLLVFL